MQKNKYPQSLVKKNLLILMKSNKVKVIKKKQLNIKCLNKSKHY